MPHVFQLTLFAFSSMLQVEVSLLDPKFAYIQVTHVTPFFTDAELTERQTDFERNNNLKNFMFETPFTKEGKPRGSIQDQYKLRTVLTSKAG